MNRIEQLTNPGEFYASNSNQMDKLGAAAFGQPVEVFGPDVARHFTSATMGQVMYAEERPAGFALYELLRGSHWQATFT